MSVLGGVNEVTALQKELVPNGCCKGELWSGILLMGWKEIPQKEIMAFLADTTLNSKI